MVEFFQENLNIFDHITNVLVRPGKAIRSKLEMPISKVFLSANHRGANRYIFKNSILR